LNGDYKIISKEVPANQLFTNGDSINEFGFDPSSKGLLMDTPSRMARAKEQGFDVDTPMYHGTNVEFDSFGVGGVDVAGKHGNIHGVGVNLSRDKDLANSYARTAANDYGGEPVLREVMTKGRIFDARSNDVISDTDADNLSKYINDNLHIGDIAKIALDAGGKKKTVYLDNEKDLDDFYDNQMKNWEYFSGFDRTMPEFVDAKNGAFGVEYVDFNAPLDFKGLPKSSVYSAIQRSGGGNITDVFKGTGYGGIEVDNQQTIFDTSNIRSPDAAFDPAKISSSNLLASNPVATAAGLGGVLAMTGSEDADAGVVGSLVKMLAKGKADGTVVNYPDELIESTPFELRKAIADHNESVLGPEYRESFGDTTFYRGGGSERSALKNDVWMSSDPYQASTYAGQIGGNVMPLKVRKGDIPEVYSNSPEWNRIGLLDSSMKIPRNEYPEELGRVIFNSEQSPYAVTDTNKIAQFAKDEGFGGVSIKGLQDIGPYQRGADLSKVRRAESLMLGDGSNARSVNAAFDPAKESSRNLLASNPVATTSAGLLANVTGQPSNLSSYMQGNTDAYLTSAERQYLQNKQAFESNFSDDTGWDRADILPFRVNEQTGEVEFATPEMIKGLLSGIYDIGQSKDTKIKDPASLLEFI